MYRAHSRLVVALCAVAAAVTVTAGCSAESEKRTDTAPVTPVSAHHDNGCPTPPLGSDGKPLPPPLGSDGKPLPPPVGADGKPCPPPMGPDGKPLPPPPGHPAHP
ncbi:hypothetical protein ACFQZZ_01840 [Nocardia sp. GCM10030253]|uniref:hypothetical protein n=1 Tax=Nocardia sp. GCM10030253 TaxID=3273404 RepID=UPI00363333C2